MPRRTKPTAESRASSDTPGDAYRLAELIDLQHQLLLGFATGTIDMAAASGAFGEAQEEIRAICGRLGAIRPPFPWGSLEAWKWEAKGFEDAADIDARLGQYRSQVDAVIAVLTGEPRWTLYPFADDQASFSRDLADLDAPKLDALQVALEEVLAIHGNALIGTKWMHKVVDGDGVYEFRVDDDEDQFALGQARRTRAVPTISRSTFSFGSSSFSMVNARSFCLAPMTRVRTTPTRDRRARSPRPSDAPLDIAPDGDVNRCWVGLTGDELCHIVLGITALGRQSDERSLQRLCRGTCATRHLS